MLRKMKIKESSSKRKKEKRVRKNKFDRELDGMDKCYLVFREQNHKLKRLLRMLSPLKKKLLVKAVSLYLRPFDLSFNLV